MAATEVVLLCFYYLPPQQGKRSRQFHNFDLSIGQKVSFSAFILCVQICTLLFSEQKCYKLTALILRTVYDFCLFCSTDPSTLGNIVEDVTHPCNPNPCAASELCEVNRKGCQPGEPCLPYFCVQGKLYCSLPS